ncbi:MAG: family 10 glycosylhydrolase [Pirellulales bacterium]
MLLAQADEITLRLRIAWNSRDGSRQWLGSVSVDGGTLSDPLPLGVEADEPGTMWIDSGKLVVRQSSPRAYDAVDVDVSGPADAQLHVDLTTAGVARGSDETAAPVTLTQSIRLADLTDAPWQELSAERPYRLDVRRTAGDRLRVQVERPHLIFSPGEKFGFTVAPHLLGAEDGTQLRYDLELRGVPNGRRVLWSQRVDQTSGADAGPFDVELDVPQEEGVYSVRIVASQHRFAQRFGAVAVAERSVQFVVVDDQPRAATAADAPNWEVVDELDPSSSSWWERIRVPILNNASKAALSSGHSRITQLALGTVLELPAAADVDEAPWDAFRLAVRYPGRPHVVEVSFPAGIRQSLGVSVVEPNAAGDVVPIGLDSGVYADGDATDADGGWQTHRLVFWPKTKSPLVLLTNHDPRLPARVGRIRLLGGVAELPSRLPTDTSSGNRTMAGHMARPLLCENFSAPEAVDPKTGRSLKDWTTFLTGGRRLVEYLKYAGYNGLSITVAADGSTIYPSAVLESTPRYDNGVYFSSGQDVIRKDVLELLHRLFDREGLRLVPVLQFSSRLPALEAELRTGATAARNLLPLRADGLSWTEVRRPKQGRGPQYNPLNSHVQDAMTQVIAELGDRYGHHASFAGAGVELSADTYALLPGGDWGVDPETLVRFADDAGLANGDATTRRQVSAVTVLADHREEWLEWRSDELVRLYSGMAERLASANPTAKLYLGGTQLFTSDDIRKQLLPELTRPQHYGDVLLELGLRPAALRQSGVVLLRPYWLSPKQSSAADSLYSEANQSKELSDTFASAATGAALLYHPPQQHRLRSFEAQSPLDSKNTLVWQVIQAVPAGPQSRRALVHQLATADTATIFEGGWLLPIGQQDHLADQRAVFTQLPDARFEDVKTTSPATRQGSSSQPVIVRTAVVGSRTYVYLVNDAPWSATSTLELRTPANCTARSLSRADCTPLLSPAATSSRWTIELEPYDLVGVVFDKPGVKVMGTSVEYPAEVARGIESRLAELQRGCRCCAIPRP